MRNQITLMSTFSMRAKLRSTVQRKTAVWLLCLMSAVLPSACGDSSSSIVTMAPADTPLARLSESPTLAPANTTIPSPTSSPILTATPSPTPTATPLPTPTATPVTDSHRHAVTSPRNGRNGRKYPHLAARGKTRRRAARWTIRLRQRRGILRLWGEDRQHRRLLGRQCRWPRLPARWAIRLRQRRMGPHLRGDDRRLRYLLGI